MQTVPHPLKQPSLLKLRAGRAADLPAIMEVERSAWPDSLQADSTQFRRRLELFPAGFMCAAHAGRIVGFSTSMLTNYRSGTRCSWYDITAQGTCANHNLDGNSMYVVSVAVHGDSQGQGIGSHLVQAQIALARRMGLERLILGARIPGYHQHSQWTAQQYIQLRNAQGEPLDQELRFYTRQGLQMDTLVPEFEEDPESLNYGVIMSIDLK